MIMLAGFVPNNSQPAAVVTDLVQAEEAPGIRHQRVDLDCVVSARAQSDQPANDEVTISRVVVVLAALGNLRPALPEEGPGDPVAVGRIEVLINPGHDPSVIEFETVRASISL